MVILQKISRKNIFGINVDHIISKHIVSMHRDTLIFEDLKEKKVQQRKGNKLDKKFYLGDFYQLTQFLELKAKATGKYVIGDR